jgi:hypothetical protein
MPNNEKRTENKFKSIGKDTILSGLKGSAQTALLAGSIGAIGTTIGVRKGLAGKAFSALSRAEKKDLIRKAVIKQGLMGAATGSIAGNTIAPAMRLRSLHKKELGANPSVSDYAKVITPRAIPNAAFWALAYKNKGAMIKTIDNSINAASQFSKTKKLNDLKPVLGGASVGGSMLLADKATDIAGFINTPESVVKKKKRRLKNGGANTMDIKTAFDVVEEAFEKTASINKEYAEAMEKEAGLSDLVKVVKGDNVRKVSRQLEHINALGGAGKVTSGVADAVGNIAGDLKKGKASELAEFMKSKGIKVDKNGNKVQSQFHKLDGAQLKGERRLLQGDLSSVGKEVGNAKKNINNTVKNLQKQKKQEFSDKDGKIKATIDNIVNARTYKNNKKFNSKLDQTIAQMKANKQLSVDDLKTEKGLFGKRKVNLGYEQDIHNYNRSLQTAQKSEKKLNRVKGSIADIDHELNYQNNFDAINKKKNTINVMDNVGKVTSKLNSTINSGASAFAPLGDMGKGALENKLKRETAKTTAARVGLGAGVVGTAAVAGGALNKPNKDNSNNVTKVAMQIVQSALMEK